jgi:hypothetical protein
VANQEGSFEMRDDDIKRLQERISFLEQAFQRLFDAKSGILGMEKRGDLPKDFIFEFHALSREIDALKKDLHRLEKNLSLLGKNEQDHHAQTLDLLVTMASELSSPSVAVTRLLPVTAYIDNHNYKTFVEVQAALRQIIAEAGFDIAFESDPVRGSWFGRFFVRSKFPVTSEETEAELRRIEQSLEGQINTPAPPEFDTSQSDGVAKLIYSLNGTPDAIIQIGSVLLVKVDGVPTVRNLTQAELAFLDRNKRLYKMPKEILDELARFTSGSPGIVSTSAASSASASVSPPS